MSLPAAKESRPKEGRPKKSRSAIAGPLILVAIAVLFFSISSLANGARAQTRPQAAESSRATPDLVSQASAAGATVPVSTNPKDIAAGEVLYDAHCESCHGPGGVGAKAPELLNVGPASVDFFLSTGRMPLASPTLEPMPGKPYFNPKQQAEIVAYINSVDIAHGTPGPGIPVVVKPCAKETPTCPTLSEGNQLFLLNCAQCHDASGSGGMLSHGYVVPSLRQATPTQIAEAVRVGPRPMPNFGPGQFSDQQVSAIADYVHYISTKGDRGGFGIANFGPVPEGFVGIIFGLGLLLLVSRFMGNRG
jgi:ubiquinol-cytochrome c reductase cytochrome c subunit